MSSAVGIRFATAEDAALVFRLIRDLARYEKLEHTVVATEASIRETLFGATPRAEVILAEVDGSAAGFALFFHNYSTFQGRAGLYLEDLYVEPEHRGTGLGRALLSRLAQIARERGCVRMEWVVLNWNEPAIGFYRRIGARPMDEWTTFRLEGAELDTLARG